jgi:hypothetical protein
MHVKPVFFKNYEEAIETLKLPEDIFIVNISTDLDSLDRVRSDLRVVYKVGLGGMKTPGHPSGNQMYYRQAPILDSLKKYASLPVIIKYSDGCIQYLGMFKFNYLRIKMSFEGFKYYEFELHRRSPQANSETVSPSNDLRTLNISFEELMK